jgi:hypothetical protein
LSVSSPKYLSYLPRHTAVIATNIRHTQTYSLRRSEQRTRALAHLSLMIKRTPQPWVPGALAGHLALISPRIGFASRSKASEPHRHRKLTCWQTSLTLFNGSAGPSCDGLAWDVMQRRKLRTSRPNRCAQFYNKSHGFDVTWGHMGFVVEKVTLKQVFSYAFGSPANFYSTNCSIFIIHHMNQRQIFPVPTLLVNDQTNKIRSQSVMLLLTLYKE